jgi:Domain of unknown function (DUF4124)
VSESARYDPEPVLRSTPTAIALLLVAAAPAYADLYRWIDPDTGSVRLSTLPPSDPRASAELLPYRGMAQKPPPTAAAGAAGQSASMPALEAELRQLYSRLAAATPQDLAAGGGAFRQQLLRYESVRAQLDSLDPAGAQRRAAEATSLMERLRQQK